jgi:hypothetical protein
MEIWNRLGDLTKGTAAWIGDIGLGVASPVKFAWDIVTAPWNDRKEFNGFTNTLKQATIDFGKNVARPFGGVLGAIEATNRNIIREPLSALFLGASDAKSVDDWKKAWSNRNKISVGQAASRYVGTQSPLGLLPDAWTPDFMDSDFNIYNPKERDKAFKDSVIGKVTSGLADTTFQLFGDITIVGGKLSMAARAADNAFEAIQGTRAALAGDVNEYAKLGEDFAANNTTWAMNHPWVSKGNNQATSAYLLGISATKEEALNTMLALLGDKTAIDRLAEIKRPDLAEPLRVASGELSRSDLKIILREETNLLDSQAEDMLPLSLRTQDEILADREYIRAWAKHDKYVDQLFEVSSEAPMTRGLTKYGQKIGRELAIARTLPFHEQEIGFARTSVYQPTPFHRLYSRIDWLERERPSGMINLNEGDSIREITAVTERLMALSKSGTTVLGRLVSGEGTFTRSEAERVIQAYGGAGTPEARAAVINNLEKRGYAILASKYGIDTDTAEKLYNYHIQVRSGKLGELRQEGFLYDAETDSMLKVPLLESQSANFLPVTDFDTVSKILGQNKNALLAAVGNGVRIAEVTSDLWKASVLLRLGYPIRNAVDSQLRIWATVGAMASLRHLGEGSRNVINNVSNTQIGTRLVDRFTGVKPVDYKSVKNNLQRIGKEVAGHKKQIDDIKKALEIDPQNPDLIGQLAIQMNLIKTKNAAYDASNKTLGDFEASRITGKKTIGQGDYRVASKFESADGEGYTVFDAMGGPNGDLYRELNSSERSFSSLVEDYSSLYGASVSSKARGIVRPEDANYYQEWAKAVNEDFANSATVRELISGKSIQDVAKWLEGNQALRARLGLARTDALEYVARLRTFVDNYIPDGYGIREKMLMAKPGGESSKVTEKFLRDMVRDPNDLPVIHGHLIEENINLKSLSVARRMATFGFKWLATVPENAWARHPLFVDLYRKSISQRVATAEALKGGKFTRQEFADIQYNLEKAARADALKGVKATLYNVERRTNAAHMLRFISPFFSAQENAVKTWLRIASDNPVIVSRAATIYGAPNRLGLITNTETGEPVDRSAVLTNNDTMWLPVPKVLKKLPLIGEGLTSLDQVGISKRSLDVVFQGNPFGVSVGPLASIPISNVIKLRPELGDTLSFIFPYGPDASVSALLPTWIRRQWEKNQGINNSDYAKTFQLIWLTEQHKARDEGRAYLTEKQIKNKVDAYYNMRTAANFILPFAPQFQSPYRYYMDKWREYSTAYGLGADDKFLQDYPDFFDFATTLSKNPTGSGATMDDVSNAKRYSSLISDISSDNEALIGVVTRGAGAAKYSPTAYWWQTETAFSPGSPETFRGKQSPQEAQQANESRKGWAIYRKSMAILDTHLKSRGLTSFEQNGAEDLKAVKQAVVQKLSAEIDPVTGKSTGVPSAWYQDYRDVDGLKSIRNVNGLRKIVNNPQFMDDNGQDPTWKSVSVYLEVRDSISRKLAARPVSNIDAKENVDLKLMLDYYINQLKSGDVEFADIYERFLSQDKIYDKYLDSGI